MPSLRGGLERDDLTGALLAAMGGTTKTVYVDTAASDTNNGLTAATAVKTLAKAATLLAAGDLLLLKRGGVWRETLAVPAANIGLDAYGADPVLGSPVGYRGLGPDGVMVGATVAPVTNNPRIDGSDVITGWAAYSAAAGGPDYTNANMETFAAGAFTGWTNTVAGSSTVTQETSIVHGGSSAAKLVSDAGGNNVSLSRTVTVGDPLSTRTLTLSVNAAAGKTVTYRVQVVGGAQAGQFLQALGGGWGAGNPVLSITGNGAYQTVTGTFVLPSDATGYSLLVGRNAGNQTFYVDDVSVTTPVGTTAPNTFRKALATQALVASRNDVMMRLGGSKDTLVDGTFWWEGGFLYVANAAGNPDGTVTIEAAQRANAVTLNALTGVTLRNLTVQRTNQEAVIGRNGSHGLTLEGCWSRQTSFGSDDPLTHVATGRNGTFAVSLSDDFRLRGCLVQDAVTDGIYAYDCQRPIIEGCVVATSFGGYSDNVQFDYATPALRAAANPIIRDSWFSQLNLDGPKGNVLSFGDGTEFARCWFEYGNFVGADGNNSSVHHCVFYRNGIYQTWGGAMYVGDDAGGPQENVPLDGLTWQHNIFIECRRASYVLGTAQTRRNINFEHNTMVDSMVCDVEWDANLGISGRVRNNIFAGAAPSGGRLQISGVEAGKSFVSDYNMLPESTAMFHWAGVAYNTLAAWRAARGQDVNSLATSPQLVGSSPFTVAGTALQAASPAIDSGIGVPDLVPRRGQPDRGATEYVG